MAITLNRGQGSCIVRLEGEIDIRSASELKQVLLEALESGTALQLDLAQATETDVTAIQLLWAAHREAEKKSLAFAIATPPSEAVAAILRDAGFKEFLSSTVSSHQAT